MKARREPVERHNLRSPAPPTDGGAEGGPARGTGRTRWTEVDFHGARAGCVSHMAKISEAETLLLETLGLPFLSYVLDATADSVSHRLATGSHLCEAQEAVLAELVAFLGKAPREDPFSLRVSLSLLGKHLPDVGASFATSSRLLAGGTVELPVHVQPLEASLVGMVRDVHPLFLLPRANTPFPSAAAELGAALFQHPEQPRFQSAVLADEDLAPLFPTTAASTGPHGMVYRSTGHGGGVQLWGFANLIIENAWHRATWRCAEPSPAVLAEEVVRLVALVRDAVRDKNVTVPSFVGIAGIRLPPGTRLAVPWGIVRELAPADLRRVPPGLLGRLTIAGDDKTRTEFEHSGDVVMEFDAPFALQIADSDLDETPAAWPIHPTTGELADQYLETLRLALALSWDGVGHASALGTWQQVLDPLSHGPAISWRDPRQRPYFRRVLLTDAQTAEWLRWIELIHEKRPKSIDIAVRRLLMAMNDRTDPSDALVDSVIAWENLFGSGQGESTLRVSTAMAWLLGKTAADRREIRAQASALYGLRSKVVHGAKILSPSESSSRSEEALGLTIRALRALFSGRPELLVECRDSSERSMRLIVDGPP